jgi:hypothetical protein
VINISALAKRILKVLSTSKGSSIFIKIRIGLNEVAMKNVIILFSIILSNHINAEVIKPVSERKPSDVATYDQKSEVKKILCSLSRRAYFH